MTHSRRSLPRAMAITAPHGARPGNAIALPDLDCGGFRRKGLGSLVAGALTGLLLGCPPCAVATQHSVVAEIAEPALPRVWRYAAHGLLLELTQRLPDPTRGFFEARGFEPSVANEIAVFFQTVVKNTAAPAEGPVEFDLGTWRVIDGKGRHRLRVREFWKPVWVARHISEAARIGFKWSLLPTRQTYASGEHNWGMTAFPLAAGAAFDLEFSWQGAGQRSTHRLVGIECAPDVHVNSR